MAVAKFTPAFQKTASRKNSETKDPCLQSSVPLPRSAQTSGMTDRERQQVFSPERENAFIRTDLKTTASSSFPSPFHPLLSFSFPWQHTLTLSLTWLARPPCIPFFSPSACVSPCLSPLVPLLVSFFLFIHADLYSMPFPPSTNPIQLLLWISAKLFLLSSHLLPWINCLSPTCVEIMLLNFMNCIKSYWKSQTGST